MSEEIKFLTKEELRKVARDKVTESLYMVNSPFCKIVYLEGSENKFILEEGDFKKYRKKKSDNVNASFVRFVAEKAIEEMLRYISE